MRCCDNWFHSIISTVLWRRMVLAVGCEFELPSPNCGRWEICGCVLEILLASSSSQYLLFPENHQPYDLYMTVHLLSIKIKLWPTSILKRRTKGFKPASLYLTPVTVLHSKQTLILTWRAATIQQDSCSNYQNTFTIMVELLDKWPLECNQWVPFASPHGSTSKICDYCKTGTSRFS